MLVARAVLGQERFEIADIVMGEPHHFRAGEPRTRPEAGMAECVHEDQVAWAGEPGDDAEIGEIAAAENQGRLRPLMGGEALFEGREGRVAAGDETGGAGAGPVECGRGLSCCDDTRILRQAEIIVAGKRDEAAPVPRRRRLRATRGGIEMPAQGGFVEAGEMVAGRTLRGWWGGRGRTWEREGSSRHRDVKRVARPIARPIPFDEARAWSVRNCAGDELGSLERHRMVPEKNRIPLEGRSPTLPPAAFRSGCGSLP